MNPRSLASTRRPLVAWFLSIGTALGALAANDPVPVSEAELAAKAAQPILFVPPEFPEAALRDGVKGTVDVIGTVKTDGAFAIGRIQAAPERDDLRKAIEEVAAYWIFRPGYDTSCRPREIESIVRVWFEVKDGKPSISLTAAWRWRSSSSFAASAGCLVNRFSARSFAADPGERTTYFRPRLRYSRRRPNGGAST